MGFIFDDEGNFELIQGDSGHINIEDIDTNKNYRIYLGIQDSKRKPIIDPEPYIDSNYRDTVKFFLSGEVTDLLTVPKNKETETYYYAIKLCYIPPIGSGEDQTEDTAILENNDLSFYNTITVYPRRVKGLEENATT